MLTVLRVLEGAPPRRRWFRRRNFLPVVYSRTVPVPDGAYRVTTVIRTAEEPDWAAIRREVGCESGRLLLPRGLTPPPGCGIAAFSGTQYTRTMMRKALEQCLHASHSSPGERSVGIYDPSGSMPRLPLELLRSAAEVRVVTCRPERYREVTEEAMAEQGASFLVRKDWHVLLGCDWIAAPEGLNGLPLHGEHGTFSAEEQRRVGVVDGFLPADAAKWLEAAPPDISSLRFLSGLFECSQILCAAQEDVETVRINGVLRPLEGLLHQGFI